MAVCPSYAAITSGASPFGSNSFTSAPCAINALTAAVSFFRTALINAVIASPSKLIGHILAREFYNGTRSYLLRKPHIEMRVGASKEG
jgi:hypothetical protein